MTEIHKSSEITLDYFLRLPRRAQLMVIEKISFNPFSTRNPVEMFNVIGIDMDEYKSPIEVILSLALRIRQYERSENLLYAFVQQKELVVNGMKYFADIYFGTDVLKDEYEIDTPDVFKLVIECDGHDYHHSNKAQVKRDYERENNLKLARYDAMRFSGSQIFEDPYGCADEIIDYIKMKIPNTLKALSESGA